MKSISHNWAELAALATLTSEIEKMRQQVAVKKRITGQWHTLGQTCCAVPMPNSAMANGLEDLYQHQTLLSPNVLTFLLSIFPSNLCFDTSGIA